MLEFETDTCQNCGEEFEAHEIWNAAEQAYCSPNCHTATN